MAQKTGTGTGTGADVCTIAPESVGTAARHRPTKAVGECAGGCIGSAVRKDHDLLKVKNQWHLGVSAARRDRPTTPRESGKFAGLSRTCRFVARTNELFQKGEAPRTTDVDSLSRPQKREQANKSRPTKSRPPNPADEFSLDGIQRTSAPAAPARTHGEERSAA